MENYKYPLGIQVYSSVKKKPIAGNASHRNIYKVLMSIMTFGTFDIPFTLQSKR